MKTPKSTPKSMNILKNSLSHYITGFSSSFLLLADFTQFHEAADAILKFIGIVTAMANSYLVCYNIAEKFKKNKK